MNTKLLIINIAFLFACTFSFAYENAYKNIIIVSDLDDTLKITNGTSSSSAVSNALFSTKVFAEMGTLYKWLSNNTEDFYILTASYTFLKKKVENLLNANNLSNLKIILKKPGLEAYEYKVSALDQLFKQYPNSKFILIGDDISHDPDVYAQIESLYPLRVLATYIHNVKGVAIHDNQTFFYTAFDIAYYEAIKGRLPKALAESIGELLLSWSHGYDFYPDFLYCPANIENNDFSQDQELNNLKNLLDEKVIATCNSNY